MQLSAPALPVEYRNQIICGDSLQVMNKLPNECVDLVVTSPPYNLRSGTGAGIRRNHSSGSSYPDVMLKGYDRHNDDLPREEYVAWQRACLREMMRLIPEHGAIFYNHKWRIQRGLLQDHREIIEHLPVRQIIIWKRPGGVNFSRRFFLPTFEVVYLIAKSGFRLAPKANALSDVWHITPEQHNPHPAPFPLALPLRIIGATEAQTVLDPFIGSGTTAVAAQRLGRIFVGIDNSPKYCAMARERITPFSGPPQTC